MTNDAERRVASLRQRLAGRLIIGEGCDIHPDVIIEVGEGGLLRLGDRVRIRRGSTLEVGPDAVAYFGDDWDVGENTFIYVMLALMVGSGGGFANGVKIHDHNHRVRTIRNLAQGGQTPSASGFVAAPIVIEDGVILSNNVCVTAGCRIGMNTLVGANAVVSRSLVANVVAAGAPATAIKHFDGVNSAASWTPQSSSLFLGTSIMEHYEAQNDQMRRQSDLPPVGSDVTVERWVNGGYVSAFESWLSVNQSDVAWKFLNLSRGGATSRDLLLIAKTELHKFPRFEFAFFGCGINDLWRKHQDRLDEWVDIDEYVTNVRTVVRLLKSQARNVMMVGETPFAPSFAGSDVLNSDIRQYVGAAREVCRAEGVVFLDCLPAFYKFSQQSQTYGTVTETSIWSDGVHLGPKGDELMFQLLSNEVRKLGWLTSAQTFERFDEQDSRDQYASLMTEWRSMATANVRTVPSA